MESYYWIYCPIQINYDFNTWHINNFKYHEAFPDKQPLFMSLTLIQDFSTTMKHLRHLKPHAASQFTGSNALSTAL